MIRIKLTMPGWPVERQTPNSAGVWGPCRFFINQAVPECDYWVVCNGLSKQERTVCPPEHTVFITHEPPTLRRYDKAFLSQFGAVITCHRNVAHPRPVFQQQGLPWHVGRRQKDHVTLSWSKDYDELIAMNRVRKDKAISIVCSSKKFSPGHKRRFRFAMRLKREFGEKVDLFGRGIREIEDKWDALAPYKYHVALENCCVDDYWTEKLGDAYLAECYPIYYGCPNINRYFSPGALTRIDIRKPRRAFLMIERCLSEDIYGRVLEEVREAKIAVLNRYNLFAMICNFVKHDCTGGSRKSREEIEIVPEACDAKPSLVRDVFQGLQRRLFGMRGSG